MKQTKVKVNGDTWLVKVIDEDGMIEVQDRDGEAVAGLTDTGERVIYLLENEFKLWTVLHELWHAYFDDLHLQDATSISLDDLEEITANLFCSKGPKIVNQAQRIYKELK